MKRALLVGHDEDIARFVTQFAPIERPLFVPPYWGFGVLKENGSLVAGIVFSDWRPDFRTIELSVVALDYLSFSTQIVSAMGTFAFEQLNANRLHARTSIRNLRACKVLQKLGFIRESVAADYYGPGHHTVTYRILRKEWLRRYVANQAKAA